MRYCALFLVLVATQCFSATDFTYQGQLKQNGTPASGSFSMDFKLFDAATAGVQQGSTITKTGVAVSNGLFVVTLDFGQSVFSGADRFLEVSVGGSALARQKLTPTPHAIIANVAAALVEQPKVRVTHSVVQSVPDSTLTALAFDTERFDDFGLHDPATNNTRLTCKEAGTYLIIGNVEFGTSSGGFRAMTIRLNGTTGIATQQHEAIGGDISTSTIYKLNVNDYVELTLIQNSGATRTISKTGNSSPEFMMTKLP